MRVQFTEIGFFLYQPGKPLPEQPNSPACRVFNETNQELKVCYAFLDYFEANGGIAQFGYPISNFEIHEDWIVQYFQRARFEWHPERPAGERVALTNLGSRYFTYQGENPIYLRPNRGDNIPQPPITDLKLRAFAATSVMPLTGSQTLFAVVQDQNLNPVEGARVNFTVLYANGDLQRLQMPATDERGVTQVRFRVNVQEPQVVKVTVHAEFRTIETQTKTSFQTWW